MRISAKLAVVLIATVVLSVSASCIAFVSLQRRALRRSEAEKERLLLESVQRVASESLLTSDPLMLISYLSFLRRERPEVVGCRVLLDGQWQEVKGPGAPPGEPGAARRVSASGPRGASREVEVLVSSRLLASAERREFDAMLRRVAAVAGGATLLGVFLSVPLSRTLTRRIVGLQRALAEIGAGNYKTSVEASGSDEIALLAGDVNETARKLSELDEMKKLLVASVSHELRSPLGAIESQVREMLAQSRVLGEPERAHLDSIRKHAGRLEHFVSSMLEVAKIERGKLEYAPRLAEIGPVVSDAVLFFSPRAKEAGLGLSARVDEGLPSFEFDPDLMAQVLANLLSNAIKFTPSVGRVTVAAGRTAAGWIEVCVEDTGVGIPAEALKRIFAPFERVSNPLRATGTGLGLAISKAIVERHGGRISASSEPGKGSRFLVELPVKKA